MFYRLPKTIIEPLDGKGKAAVAKKGRAFLEQKS
jgi:hypothetical protein